MTVHPTSAPGSREPCQAIRHGGPAPSDAEINAIVAAHREWLARGRPGAVSHEEAMAELLGSR